MFWGLSEWICIKYIEDLLVHREVYMPVLYYHFTSSSLSLSCNIKSFLGTNQIHRILTDTTVKHTHTLPQWISNLRRWETHVSDWLFPHVVINWNSQQKQNTAEDHVISNPGVAQSKAKQFPCSWLCGTLHFLTPNLLLPNLTVHIFSLTASGYPWSLRLTRYSCCILTWHFSTMSYVSRSITGTKLTLNK